jgi:hypothetical protein
MDRATETDIVVIGGGSAGLCAAIAAARMGMRVILIERSERLGGMGTLAKVHTFCGLYHPDVSRPPQIANPGLPAEIEQLMRARTGVEPVRIGKVYVLPQDPAAFAEIAHDLTISEKSLEVRFNTTCKAITRGVGESFVVETNTGSISCNSLIDASADAVVADFLGATRLSVPPEKNQRSAFVFSLQGVDPSALDESFRMRLALEIVRAVTAGELPKTALGTASRSSTIPGEIYFTTDLDPAPRDELMATGRALAEALAGFLRGKFPAYAFATGPILAEEPGVRETFRWKGQYLLTEQDLISGREFPDTVAYATWPIELRETTRGAKLRFFDRSVPGCIPLRSLTSSEIGGVFFAGRCISATHEAIASVRVMGTCFATGQAAGQAAAAYVGLRFGRDSPTISAE